MEGGLTAEKIKVKSNGVLLATPFGGLNTICSVDPEKFPVDCHRCTILIGASTTTERQIFRWGTPALKNLGVAPEHAYWEVYDVVANNYPPLSTLDMTFKRLPLYYMYTIVFPASALSVLCVMAFFIPIEEGERVGYGMTIFLSFMVLMLQVGNSIPESSRSFPAIGKFTFYKKKRILLIDNS